MDAGERAIIVDLVHIEAVETQDQDEEQQEALDHEPAVSEATSALRTAACVAPSPPDPDYFVG